MHGKTAPWVLIVCLVSVQAGPQHEEGSRKSHRRQSLSAAEPDDAHLKFVLQDYLTNAELERHMQNFTSRCSNVGTMFSIGKSAHGTELWALEISNRPGVEEPKPRFKYVGNMHGDEPTGRVLQLALAEWLCAHWKTDARAKRIVEGMKLYLLPTMNPDGFSAKQRGNSAKKDLNRDFPDAIELGDGHDLSATGKEQPETLAVMQWSLSKQFVASASFHEGAYVANYPWDGTTDKSTRYAACPDDSAFMHMARAYASLHGKMNASQEFIEGITNGAAWYPLWGGMQDWNYLAARCMELTLEVSQNKWPPAEQLPSIWEDNKLALVNLPLVAVFGGVRGFVKEAQQRMPYKLKQKGLRAVDLLKEGKRLAATISVEGIDHNITASNPFGDYYRPLAPGDYLITASMPGYVPQTAGVRITADNYGRQHNFYLASYALAEQAAVLGPLHSRHHGSSRPRKLGGDPLAVQSQTEEEELLISEGMWINMMQTALVFFLGCSIGLLGISALVAMRLVSFSRSSLSLGSLRSGGVGR